MYPRIGKYRWRQIRGEIRHLLLTKWEPIGVRHIPEAQNEYDSYIFGVYKLLVFGASEQEIADYLYEIETERMGLRRFDVEARLPIARALRRVNVSP